MKMLLPDSSYILFFHRIFPENIKDFEWILDFLRKNKKVATIYEIDNLKPNQVIITFDDGFFDNFVYAYPLLLKYNLPATIFLSTAYLKEQGIRKNLNDNISFDNLQKPKDYNFKNLDSNEFLTWEEVDIMLNSGLITFESHGFTHLVHFTDNKPVKNPAKNNLKRVKYLNIDDSIKNFYKVESIFKGFEYLINEDRFETKKERTERLLEHFTASKELIETYTYNSPEHFCWPWGEFDDFSIKVGKEAGYNYFYTTDKGCLYYGFNYFEKIPRISCSFNKKTFLKRDFIFSRKKLTNIYLKFFN